MASAIVGDAAPFTTAHRRHAPLAALLLAVHIALLMWGGWSHSPTWDEPAHLASGIGFWEAGRLDLYRVNPPLGRAVAALPVLLFVPEIDWSRYAEAGPSRPEFSVGAEFLRVNGERSFWLLALARWVCIPFSVLAGLVCYAWARQWYGRPAGLVALALWCFSPAVLGHGQLITPDVAGAATGAAVFYAFWRWLDRATWRRAAAAGGLLGLALLAKTTWIVLFGYLPLVWLIWVAAPCRRNAGARLQTAGMRQLAQLIVILILGLGVLNLGYAFDGSFRPLGDYQFASRALAGRVASGSDGNRFAQSWLQRVPVPAPGHFVLGIDVQKAEFDRQDYSYLRGTWQLGGWWYYYLYAMAVKVPLGTWGLGLLALGVRIFGRAFGRTWQEEWLLLVLPAVLLLALVSSQTGVNRHMRYILPVAPFAFVWISRVALAGGAGKGASAGRFETTSGDSESGPFGLRCGLLAAPLLAWSVASSLWIYPHSMSYFNELAGGPLHGHAHLGSSNVDWGQDLLYLRRWMLQHPEARPLGLAFDGGYQPAWVGIPCFAPSDNPRPGWYALSVNRIRGLGTDYAYFLQLQPAARGGYSIQIYHLSLEQANRLRRQLGWAALPPEE